MKSASETIPLPPRTARIYAVDFVRVFAVLLVVAVHVITQPVAYNTPLADGLVILFHVSREIFLLITGLVLTYSTAHAFSGGWKSVLKFYWRRYPLILIPYLTWTLIYMVSSHTPITPFGSFWSLLVTNLQTGNASYQLYFLIVTMKLYLIFPLLRWILQNTRKYHVWIVAVSAMLQIFITSAMHYGWGTQYRYVSQWFATPDPAIISYQFYIIAGCVAAFHLPQIVEWARRRIKAITVAAAFITVIAVASYVWQLQNGAGYLDASAVFQPVVFFESVIFTLALFAWGIRWEQSGMRFKKLYLMCADASFGVYLAHLLILTWLSELAEQAGWLQALGTEPAWLILAVLVFIVTPLTYALSAAGIELFRKTPLSLPLSGRPWAKTKKTQSATA